MSRLNKRYIHNKNNIYKKQLITEYKTSYRLSQHELKRASTINGELILIKFLIIILRSHIVSIGLIMVSVYGDATGTDRLPSFHVQL